MNLVPQKRFMEHVSGTYSTDVRRILREIEVSRVFAYERTVPIPQALLRSVISTILPHPKLFPRTLVAVGVRLE